MPRLATKVRRWVKDVWVHPANQGRGPQALGQAAAWKLYARCTGRHWDVPLAKGLRIRCYRDSVTARQIVNYRGRPDFHEMRFIERYLKPGEGFVDVGANIGMYTILAASLVENDGLVEVFEPDKTPVERLRENIAINGLTNVRVHPVAVGATAGKIKFVVDLGDCINRIQTARDVQMGSRVVETECLPLDDVLVGGHYSMGKMDIEGAEPLALQGAARSLENSNPPVWQLEMSNLSQRHGFTPQQIMDWLSDFGYDIYLYDALANKLSPIESPPQGCVNVLAIARNHYDEVQARIATA